MGQRRVRRGHGGPGSSARVVVVVQEVCQLTGSAVELEFAVEMHRDAKVKAGFKAWLISAEA
ncbi:trypco2 family protein [Amycolatopsis sp. NPDC051128]|uniref:trypco2 family protein n=1 Tax=Amycolatopsis sp. NPDC051128 TaxID=3155412 RepID=UPI0034486229